MGIQKNCLNDMTLLSGQNICCSFTDNFDQLKCVPNRGEFSVFSSVGHGNLGNYSKPRRYFDTVLCREYEGVFFALYPMKFDLVL